MDDTLLEVIKTLKQVAEQGWKTDESIIQLLNDLALHVVDVKERIQKLEMHTDMLLAMVQTLGRNTVN